MSTFQVQEIAHDVEETLAVTHSNESAQRIVMSTTVPDAGTVHSLPPSFYSDFLSDAGKERKPSPIRNLFPLESRPGMISLLAGKPDPSTFPITSLNFAVRSPTDPTKEVMLQLSDEQLVQGLQYGSVPELAAWLEGLQGVSHGRKQGEGWRVSIGTGSQDMIYKAIMAMVNPGDSILIDSPAYAAVVVVFKSLHCEQIEIETDAQGICSHSLRSILENWPAGKPKPKVLYTVPYGCNPTGATASLERRKEVLLLAREHNFVILEDDPYYYLYFGAAPRPSSYFALELEQPEVGRVLRFDSLSKIVSAGIRIGWVSGPEPILRSIDLHTQTANLQSSSLSQTICYALLNSWGYDGFLAHTQAISQIYRQKRDVFEQAMTKHLSGLAEWITPEAGMFVWFKLLLDSGGELSHPEEGDSETVIKTKALEHGVLALPGAAFLPNGRRTAYVRASFSMIGPEDIDEAMKRLRTVVIEARAGSEE